MAYRHAIHETGSITPPFDALAFTVLVAPLICCIILTELPAVAGAALILGWCLILGAQGLYSTHVLTSGSATQTARPGHLAAMLESECDSRRHHRRLRMLAGGLLPANACVMIAAVLAGLLALGPLWAVAGAGLVYALAVYSYVRAVRYTIWCISALFLGYAGQLTLTVGTPAHTNLSNTIVGADIIALGLSVFAAILAYRFTVIVNLRHIAAIAFAHAGLGFILLSATNRPTITNLVILATFLVLPGLCALAGKCDRHCRHRLYSYGDRY